MNRLMIAVILMVGISSGCGESPNGTSVLGVKDVSEWQSLDCDDAREVVIDGHGSSGPVARPAGEGNVSHYGNIERSYAGSPEIVWKIVVPEPGCLSLFVAHDTTGNIDLFLLKSCNPEDLVTYRDNGTNSEHINWDPPLEAGTYFLVADAPAGGFQDESLNLSYDFMLCLR